MINRIGFFAGPLSGQICKSTLGTRPKCFFNNNFELFSGIAVCPHHYKIPAMFVIKWPNNGVVSVWNYQFIDFLSTEECEFTLVHGWRQLGYRLSAIKEEHEPMPRAFKLYFGHNAEKVQVF